MTEKHILQVGNVDWTPTSSAVPAGDIKEHTCEAGFHHSLGKRMTVLERIKLSRVPTQ